MIRAGKILSATAVPLTTDAEPKQETRSFKVPFNVVNISCGI